MTQQLSSVARNPRAIQITKRLLLIYAIACVIGLLAGIISASGRPVLIAIFVGLLATIAVSASRNALLWLIIIGGLVVTGVAQLYLPGSKYIRYLIPLAAFALFLHAIMGRLLNPVISKSHTISSIVLWGFAFITVALMSTAVNWGGAGAAFIGLKGYFQMWIFFFALIIIHWKREVIDSLPKVILFIAFLQLPFVLHQYFVLVPIRGGVTGSPFPIVPVDVVAGTFGAKLLGGGANAVLVAFLIIVVACLLGIWKQGVLSSTKTLVMSLALLFPTFINEAKITAVYLPIIFLMLFYRDIIKRPLRFMVASGVFIGLFAVLLTALTVMQPTGKVHSWSDLIDHIYERQTSKISDRHGLGSELTRWTALTFWLENHISTSPVQTIIGHGPGSSRVQDDSELNSTKTLAETRYSGLKIGYTALSALLWDTGILGLVTVLGLFFAAFRTAGQLATYFQGRDPFHEGVFDGLRAGIAVLTMSLAHKDFFAFHLPYQTLVLLIFGYLVIAHANMRKQQNDENRDLMVN